MKVPPQIVRLLLTTLIIVATYSIARYFLTPPTFGQYGWYRGEALREATARAPVFAGKKACEECHSDVTQKVAAAEHKTLACETCHGVSKAHSENPDVGVPKLTYSHCVRCHETDPSRPTWLKQVRAKEHYTGQRCTECHVPHQPNEVP
jgi:hypothetical protein